MANEEGKRRSGDKAAEYVVDGSIVGVGYALQEADGWDEDPWDVRLDAIVTERERIDVAGSAP